MICSQQGCGAVAAYRFTWPGEDEAGICVEHAPHMRGVAEALGLRLQLIPLPGPSSENEGLVDDPGE